MLTAHRHFDNLPHPADTSGGQGSGHYLWSLLHEAPHREPQAVSQGVLVFQHVPVLSQTWVRVIPLIRAKPGRETTRIWLWGQTAVPIIYLCHIIRVSTDQSLGPCQTVGCSLWKSCDRWRVLHMTNGHPTWMGAVGLSLRGVWCNVWTLQPGREHSWQPGRRAAWRARRLERRGPGRRSSPASGPGAHMEQRGQKQKDGWTDRQTDTKGVREQGVASQQKGYIPFAPQEGSVPHCSLPVRSAPSL